MATDRLINKDQGDQIITKLDAIKTAMQTQTDGIVSDAFNENASYYAGDYCINNDTLYKFTSDHSGAWDLADVTATNVGDELASVKSALGEQSSASGVTGDDAFSKIGTLDTRTKQRNIGVTLNSTGNEYFTHELTRSMVANGVYIVWFRVVAKKAVTTIDVDMNIGTVSVPPQYQILGYITNIDATLMEGSVLISANSNIYLRFTNTLPIGRALVVTAIGTYL